MRELILKKCNKCGSIIKVIKNGEIKCCGDMIEIKPNSVDAAFEKHVPVYTVEKDKLLVQVNHVMELDHYIEWIAFITDNSEEYVFFKPGDTPIANFKNRKGILYSYCNKHMLWMNEVK